MNNLEVISDDSSQLFLRQQVAAVLAKIMLSREAKDASEETKTTGWLNKIKHTSWTAHSYPLNGGKAMVKAHRKESIGWAARHGIVHPTTLVAHIHEEIPPNEFLGARQFISQVVFEDEKLVKAKAFYFSEGSADTSSRAAAINFIGPAALEAVSLVLESHFN